MVLLAGPRQAGETTLALEVVKEFKSYDHGEDRRMIMEESWFSFSSEVLFAGGASCEGVEAGGGC